MKNYNKISLVNERGENTLINSQTFTGRGLSTSTGSLHRLPNGTSLQQSINTNKANKTIRLEAEMKQINSISDRIEVANFQRNSRKAKRELRTKF